MTIHQAKGLEFDVVVLPDLEAQLVGQHDACVVGQPGPAEPFDRVCLYRNTHVQSLLPDSLRELFDDAIRQSVTEALCVLYVAVTRAVHALHMLLPPSGDDERSLHKTPGGLVRAALAESDRLPPQSIVFEHGDADWHRGVSGEAPKAIPVASPATPEKIQLAAPNDLPHVGLQRESPSGLEGGAGVALRDVLRLDNSIALLRGTIVHAWFEQIEWLDDGFPSKSLLRRVANDHDATGLDIEQLISQFQTMLRWDATSALLSRSFYAVGADRNMEVHNERRFAVRDHDRILSGTIDRLVLTSQSGKTVAAPFVDGKTVAADIIDFKTDAIDPLDSNSLHQAVEYYRPQLEAYRTAVARMFQLPLPRVSARLLFVGAGIMCPITEGESRAANSC